jgi:adenylate cyclase
MDLQKSQEMLPPADAVAEQLSRLLHSTYFAQSARRSRFLRYIVEETLAGRGDRLKGYRIGVEVFDKPPSFDPIVDPLVRVEAGRLRDKLRVYYAEAGRDDPIVIELPKGTYEPVFMLRSREPRTRNASGAARVVAEPMALGQGIDFELASGESQGEVTAEPERLYREILRLGVELPLDVADGKVAAITLPDRASIAVLAFDNLSNDPEQDYLGDGIAEDLITALSHLRGLLVIARHSSFRYKGKAVDVRQIGEDLGVRHVLEGSVRKVGEQLRIIAQLVDARTRDHLWAERFDRPAQDLFAVQDEIVERIVTELDLRLADGEEARAWRSTTANPKAYELFLRARELGLMQTREAEYQAITLSEQALRLDRNFAAAWVWQGWMYNDIALSGWCASASEYWEKAIYCAHRALALGGAVADAHALLGEIHIQYKGDFDKGIRELETAIASDPNCAKAYAFLAGWLPYVGRSAEAMAALQKAWRINPYPDDWYLWGAAWAYWGTGHCEKAITIWEECARRLPDHIWSRTDLTIAFMRAAREQDARAQAKEVLRIDPKFSLSGWAARIYQESDVALLSKAGLPK